MKNVVLLGISCVLVAILSGCAAVPAGIASSTKPLDQNGYTQLGPTKGRSVGVYLMGIIPLSEPYPARKSVDRAIERGGGDALVNVTTDHMILPIPIIQFTISTTHGTAVQSK